METPDGAQLAEPGVTKPEAATPEVTKPEVAEQNDAGNHGYSPHRDDLLKRLRRAEGQVRGIHGMVDRDEYCIDIITQVSAVTKALERVALALLDDHLRHCVAEATTQGEAVADAKMKEASDAIARLLK